MQHARFFCPDSVVDARHCLQHLVLLLVEPLLHGKALGDIDVDHLTGPRADDAVRLAVGQRLDGVIAMRLAMTRSRADGVPPRWI